MRRVRCRGSNWRSLETGAAFALLLPSLLRLCSVLWVSAAGKGKEGPTLSATPGSSSILSVTHSLNVQHAWHLLSGPFVVVVCGWNCKRERKKKLRDRWRHRAHLGARYKWQRGSKRTGQWKKKTGPSFLKMHNDVDQERNVKSAASLSRRRKNAFSFYLKALKSTLDDSLSKSCVEGRITMNSATCSKCFRPKRAWSNQSDGWMP